MKGFLYIDNDKIGEVRFIVTDESMGAIGGQLSIYGDYQKYRLEIQQHCKKKGISNIDDFNYRIILADNIELKPEGGIGITDVKDSDEIYIESAGLDSKTIKKIKDSVMTQLDIIKGQYTGFYKYDKERIQKSIAHEKTLFQVDIIDTDGINFNGKTQDDMSTGGTPGIGTITGEIDGERVNFIKQMPIAALITTDGQMKTLNQKHRKIYYEGVKSKGVFKGTWKLKSGFIFLGLIPIPMATTTGTWEMRKCDEESVSTT